MKIVRFERRVISYLIDLIVTLGIAFLIYFFILKGLPLVEYFSMYFWIATIQMVVFFILCTLVSFLTNGYTLGNFICQVKMVCYEKERLSFTACSLKYCMIAIHAAVFINALYMIIVRTERSIFDSLSQTILVSTKKEF